MNPYNVQLLETASGRVIDALLHPDLPADRVVTAEATWAPARRAIEHLIEHGHWNWSRKAVLIGQPGVRFVGLEYAGVMQGMMALTETGHTARLPTHYGLPLVYVEFLEAAPWNLRLPGHPSRYNTVGTKLLRHAVALSIGFGFDGRVGLLALRQAEGFYERACWMVAVGEDPHSQGLMCYEYTAEQADWFLKET